ncbi:MAG: WbqC family protein [Tumebacillaceae bacterium]
MIVTIHQPNLYPHLGFFDKMACADVFVLLDNTQFTKRGYQNRVQLKGPNGAQWLTLPVKSKGRYDQLTREVEVNEEQAWRKEHLKTFELLYRGTNGYTQLIGKLEELYASPCQRLTDLTVPGIELIKRELGIETPLVSASDLNVQGKSSQLLCDLVKAVGGTTYLSGPSGRDYLEESMFAEQGVRLEFHQFEPVTYPQRFGAFVGGLSALDYLFHEPNSTRWRR